MNKQIPIKKYIENALQSGKLAVLATEKDGQPHVSLISFTPIGGHRQLIIMTNRNTRKFENLTHNAKVAILIQGEEPNSSGQQNSCALTAFGTACEISIAEHEEALHSHLERHPDLANYLQKSDLALILITVDTYQVVRSIDNVSWWSVSELETSSSMVSY
jgi:nitroimidazol reductase NimA-like FMN-containing flavoprotein (pyridoxamine 5'-phosphate oxidase superfamily)